MFVSQYRTPSLFKFNFLRFKNLSTTFLNKHSLQFIHVIVVFLDNFIIFTFYEYFFTQKFLSSKYCVLYFFIDLYFLFD